MCFLLLSGAAIGQLQDFSPSISVGGNIYPSRDVKNQSGTYGRQFAYARINVPIVKTFNVTDGRLKFFLLSGGLHASAENAKFSFLGFNRTFYTGSLSLNSIYKTSGKSSWLTKATVSYFEDDSSIYRNPSLRVTGCLLHRHAVSESFFYLLGGAYNFVYGTGLPLPILGVGWKFTNHATLTAVLPFNVSYRFGKRGNQYTLFVRPNGSVSNFYNNVFDQNRGSTIVVRRREILVGLKKRIRLSDHWSVGLDGGFAAGRKILFSKSFTQRNDETYPSFAVKGGPYLSLSVRFRLKEHKRSDGESSATEDQLGLDSLLPSY